MGIKTTPAREASLRKVKSKSALKKASKHSKQQMEFFYPQDSKHLMAQIEKEHSSRHSNRY